MLRSKDLPFTVSNQGIKVFRHALALDEVRFDSYVWSIALIPVGSVAQSFGQVSTVGAL